MRQRPLVVGAIVALVGAALAVLWAVRGADAVSEVAAPAATSSPVATRSTPAPTRPFDDRPPLPTTAPAEPSPQTDTPTEPQSEGSSDSPDAAPASTAPATAEPPPRPASRLSTRAALRIPGIGLQAGMHAEGLRAGRINPPAGTVMWFNGQGRVAPGEVGTSVIAGHVVSGGRPDVFGKLSRVRVGERVEVTGTDGVARSFTVVRAGVVGKRDLTTDYSVWGPNSSVRRLAIITCDDAFGFRGDGHRVANYVVIAEPA